MADRFLTKNEFRFNYNTKHMNYVFLEKNKKYRAIGLTTEPETFGKKNMPLLQNAQKGHSEPSFIRNGIISGKKNNFAEPDKRFLFSDSDFKNVKSKIRNYKNRVRKQKKISKR